MNADDEKRLRVAAEVLLDGLDNANPPEEREIDFQVCFASLRTSYDWGRRAGMTKAAGICRDVINACREDGVSDLREVRERIAAAIEKARDA